MFHLKPVTTATLFFLPGFFPLTASLPFIYDCQDGAIKAISLCWNFIMKPFVLLKEK